MKLLEHKPIQDGYIVYFVDDNQANQIREFQDLDKAGSFIRSIEKDFKALISISNGELIAIYSDMQEVMSLLSIHWQLEELNGLSERMQHIKEFLPEIQSFRKPTMHLIYQSFDNPIKTRPLKRKNLRHNEKIIEAILTSAMIELKNENGNFTLRDNKAEFEDKIFILPEVFSQKLIIKKRIFKR